MKRTLKFCLLVSFFSLLFCSCVKNEVTGITLNSKELSFTLGQTDSLIAKVSGTGDLTKLPVVWSTSNSQVVTVKDGKVKGIATGTAIITVKSGNISSTCNITVNNEIKPNFRGGFYVYFGDTLHTKTSNLCLIGLVGLSDTIYLYINTSLNAGASTIPIGKYNLLTSITQPTDLIPFSAMPGMNNYQFSWYFGKSQNPIQSGYVTVGINVSGYTLNFNLIDYFGNSIYGSYAGYLNFYNETKVPASKIKDSRFRVSRFNAISRNYTK
jgi:Bacterial surface proteins containing Ig-like domains